VARQTPTSWGLRLAIHANSQILHKWLSDRKGRKPTFNDLFHWQKIVVALKETMRLMGEIDELIPSWPIE